MLSGEQFSAQQAQQWGLINEAAPAEGLEALFKETLNNLLKGAPGAHMACKQLLQYIQSHSLKQNLTYATEMLYQLRKDDEAHEGIAAFMEKRKPNWNIE